jgi:hypothetical protein
MQGSGVGVSKDAGKICATPSEPRGTANSECSTSFLQCSLFLSASTKMGEVVHERDEPRLARRGDFAGAKILEDCAAKRIPGC